jgi:hypothetical protein
MRKFLPKLKLVTIIPSNDEDAAISAGIAANPDTVDLDDQWFVKLSLLAKSSHRMSTPLC